MSPDRRRRGLAGAVVFGILLAAIFPGPLPAGEAMARGRNAKVIWLDEKGVRREAAGKQIRYGYFRRVYLQIPKDGKSFRDEEYLDKGLPFAEDFIKFSTMERVDFARETDPESGTDRLKVTVSFPRRRAREGRGATLAGATHPASPFIQYELDGVAHRIELHPIAPAAQRRGKPQLLSLDFSL